MMRPNSFVLNIICIILILFNCSACADRAIYSQSTVNDVIKNVPTLFTINGINSAQYVVDGDNNNDDDDDNGTSVKNVAEIDNAQNQTINGSSHQRIEDDFGLIPNHQRNYRNENSKTQSILESRRLKRTPQDICETSECKCKLDTKFLTVDCYFQQVSQFDSIDFCMLHILLFTLATVQVLMPFNLDANVFHIEVQCVIISIFV